MGVSRHTYILAVIVIVHIVLLVLYAGVTPAWESPDEPAHYLYTAHLGQTWQPPPRSPVQQTGPFFTGGYITSMYEWYHPAGGYLVPAAMWRILNAIDSTLIPDSFPSINPLAGQYPTPGPYLFLPERAGLFEPTAQEMGLIILRLASALLSIPLVLAVYVGARLVAPEQPYMGVTAAGLVAFIPQFTFISATLRNDTTANMMSAISIVLLLRLIQKPVERPRIWVASAGAVLGMTILTKAVVWFLVPLAFLAVWLTPYQRRRRIELIGMLIVSTAIIVSGVCTVWPQTIRSLIFNLTHATIRPEHLSLSYLARIPGLFMHLFWGRFGWANVALPNRWATVPTILAFVGMLLTLSHWFYAHWTQRLSRVTHKQLVLLTVAVLLNGAGIVRYNLYIYQPQGRFLFPSLLPLSVLCLWGFWQVVDVRTLRITAGICLIGALLALNVAALFKYLVPAYYQRWLPAAAHIATDSQDAHLSLSDTTTVGQTFVAAYPVLHAIDVAYEVDHPTPSTEVRLHLRASPSSNKDIAVVGASTKVIKGRYHRFILPAVSVPTNQRLYFFLEISGRPENNGRPIQVYRTAHNGYDAGMLYVDGTPRAGDLNFVVFSSVDDDTTPP